MRPKLKRLRHFLLCSALAGAGVTVCAAAERPLRVVALHTVLAEIAREVGGPDVAVTDLVPVGIDPHTFDPAPGDLRMIVDADLVLTSGLHLEPYLDRLLRQRGSQARILTVGDALPLVLYRAGKGRETPGRPGSGAGEPDPHWWQSIDNVLFATNLVRARLSELRPAWSEEFARNARAYEQRLRALKAWVAAQIARLPPGRRQLVTSHDAFGYFARDYGFTVHPISGFSTDSEPNARRLAGLIDLIRRERIPAVFAESSVNPQLVANLVSETGVRLGGTLYADGLGPDDAGTYEGMYRHNVSTIVDALVAR